MKEKYSHKQMALLRHVHVVPQFRLCLGQNSHQVFRPIELLHRREELDPPIFGAHQRVPDAHLKGHSVIRREGGPYES